MGGSHLFKKVAHSSGYRDPEILVGLDLGTNKVSVVVAERENNSGEAQIIGIGQALSTGIRKGLIVNLDQAVKSVKQALGDAENMVGLELHQATIAFSGGEVASIRSKGMISMGRTPRPVMQLDIERVIEAAQADVLVPQNQTIVHTIPVEYSLDGNNGVDDPLGMTGMRLDIDLVSVIVPTAHIQNVLNCVEKAGIEVVGLVIKPLASALGVLSHEEAIAGSILVDVGGGTTGVAVFAEGRPKHLAVIPVGGDHITNDVTKVLRIPLQKAEELKREVGFLGEAETSLKEHEFSHLGRSYVCDMRDMTEVVQCRVEELFQTLVKKEIDKSGMTMFPGGLIVTGGVAKTKGIDRFLSELMDMQVRVGVPIDSSKMPPGRNGQEYSCAAGIIRYALEKERDLYRYMEPWTQSIKNLGRYPNNLSSERRISQSPSEDVVGSVGKSVDGIWDYLKRMFREIF